MPEPSTPTQRVHVRESDFDAARAFAKNFAVVERSYGGGVRVYVDIGGRRLDALDGWNGEDAAFDALAQKLVQEFHPSWLTHSQQGENR